MNVPRARSLAVLTALLVTAVAAMGASSASANPGSGQTSVATILNFDQGAVAPPGYPHGAQVVKLDVEGNALDAKSDYLTHFGDSYYLYGEAYGCTYMFFPSPGFCGFRVYQSRDLMHWRDDGPILDAAASPYVKETCASATGCWGPIVVHNPNTGKYLLWFYRAIGKEVERPLVVMEGESPTGPWVNPTEPNVKTGFAQDIFIDQDGSAYLVWGGPSTGLSVQQLNSTWTDVTGPETIVTRPGGSIGEPKCQPPGGLGGENFQNQTPALLEAWKKCGLTESPSIARHGNRYYLTFSNPICAFCLGTETAYFVAESPLGPWHGVGGSPSYVASEPGKFDAYTLSPDTCGGQPFHIAHLPTAGGGEVDLFAAALWENSRNEGSANHYWEPLRWKNGLLQELRCTNTKVPLAEPVAKEQAQPLAINLAAVGNGSSLTQTMVAPATGTIRSIELPIYQKTNPTRPFATEGLVSEPLTVTLSGPGGESSATLTPEAVSWSPTRVTLALPVQVQRGDELTLTLASATPKGRYGTLFEDHDGYREGGLTGSGEAAGLVNEAGDLLFKALEATARGAVTFGP